MSSSLNDFSVRQNMDAGICRFKPGRAQHFEVVKANSFLWPNVRILYSNVRVVDSEASLDLVLNAPKKILTRPVFGYVFKRLKAKAVDFGLDDIKINVSVIPK